MHTQAVTFAFTVPRPRGLADLRYIGRDAATRAKAMGIRNISISAIPSGGGGQSGLPYSGFRVWTAQGRIVAKERPYPAGHIAVLVEGFAEKE